MVMVSINAIRCVYLQEVQSALSLAKICQTEIHSRDRLHHLERQLHCMPARPTINKGRGSTPQAPDEHLDLMTNIQQKHMSIYKFRLEDKIDVDGVDNRKI
ncbi:hypothetical protein EYR41_003867 [Orbilia oligospora]|uniref:Uncharacterized protein n=1 Tax=Orbilia oligospora TaxID=2813651 RepID=A0A7C8KJB8_ORBOL|nr:hypothetical protein TWF751_003712 [Orbilia oligospora]TGJ71944.1 hypothetical protein EYR41_003867 [Orbilia oligospora]